MRILFFTVGLMMAHQVLGKAARDTLFVFYYGAEALPLMKAAAAAFAVLIGLTVPRAFQRYGTARAVPTAFCISGLLHIFEYALRTGNPRVASILVYLHIVSLSAILQSSFWLMFSERFDPGEARRWLGRLAGYGTLGGIAGGLVATGWSAAGLSALSLFLVMGVFHIVCGLFLLGQSRQSGAGSVSTPAPFLSARTALSSAPYLRALALIVFLGTTAASMFDILFVTAASANFQTEAGLFRFFAIFQVSTQVVCFLLQSFVVHFALDRFGIGANIGALPAMVVICSAGAFFNPGFAALAFGRGFEYLVRGTFFRSGYELFYSPIPPQEKRAAKNLIDVVFDRAGDAAGGFIVQFFMRAGVSSLSAFVLPLAAAIGAANLYLSLRLGRSYPEVVHRGLTDRAEHISEHLSRFGDWSIDTSHFESGHGSKEGPAQPGGWAIPAMDETTRRIATLRSGDANRIRNTLNYLDKIDPVLVPVLVDLLGWGEVWKEARAVLANTGRKHVGQFVDVLTNPDTDFAIRRRIPTVLSACGGPIAVEGLVAGLGDSRFEVRLQCARALDIVACGDGRLVPPQDQILSAIDRELSLPPQVWQGSGVIDEQVPSPGPQGSDYLSETPERPADHRLWLLFCLLALMHPRELLKAAFRALHTKDNVTCALGLEYVDSILPASLRAKFRGLMAAGVPEMPPPRPKRSREDVATLLLASQASPDSASPSDGPSPPDPSPPPDMPQS